MSIFHSCFVYVAAVSSVWSQSNSLACLLKSSSSLRCHQCSLYWHDQSSNSQDSHKQLNTISSTFHIQWLAAGRKIIKNVTYKIILFTVIDGISLNASEFLLTFFSSYVHCAICSW